MAEFISNIRKRITETGDFRVTEDGVSRVLSAPNAGVGVLVAEGVHTSYRTLLRYSVGARQTEQGVRRALESGDIRGLESNIVTEASWREPAAVYARVSGAWVPVVLGRVFDLTTWKRMY
jgi:hypothetical protein